MALWIVIFIIFIAVIGYVLLWTPYPFVWLLRHQKEDHHNKAPDTIDEIRKDVIIQKSFVYPSNYPNNTYDLYVPKEKQATHVLIWIHGGAFIAGTSEGTRNYAIQLAHQGIIVVAMNYAYAPRYPFPVQIKQVDELLVHLENMRKLPSNIPYVIGGDSAGANIAANFTNLLIQEALRKETQIELHCTKRIQGQLLFCGPYDFCEDVHQEQFQSFRKFFNYIGWSYLGSKHWETSLKRKLASPLHFLSEHHPAMYIVDGKKYSFLWQGKKLAEKGKQLGISVKSDFFEECPHEFQFDYQKYPTQANTVLRHSLAFLSTIKQDKNS